MIRAILSKDWKLLWPMVVVVAAIQMGYDWAVFSSGLFGEDPAAEALLRPLTLAWFIGIAALTAAVVHQDPIPGADQDWLIRPLNRTQLLVAKLVFLALSISAPMFVFNLVHALAMGMPLVSSLIAVLGKELFIFGCFIIPVAALAASTRNMTELVVLGAALVLIFASSLSFSALLFGADWCPTCQTGMAWLQHLVQHVGILLGAGVILFLQYYRRRSAAARGVAVIGAVCLVFLQLPWNAAFDIERWICRPSGDAAPVALEPAGEARSAEPTSPVEGGSASRKTTLLLLHGHVEQAFANLHRRGRPGEAPVRIDLPVRVLGASADERILVDRSQTRFFGEDGRLLYRGADAGRSLGLLEPEPGDATLPSGSIHQRIDIPGSLYRQAAATAMRLQIDYWLTLVRMRTERKIAVLDGELQSSTDSLCATRHNRDTVTVRCKSITQAPFCFSGTLYASDGRHDPEVFQCTPDYRRHWPPLMDVLNFYEVDLPLRDPYGIAHYAIGASELGGAYVLLKIYGEFDHFKRTLAVAAVRPR